MSTEGGRTSQFSIKEREQPRTERKTPRFKRRLDSLAKKPSTALSQEHEVGETKRSCRSCVCDEQFWTSNQHRYDGKGLGC